jgi:hypothetical protein
MPRWPAVRRDATSASASRDGRAVILGLTRRPRAGAMLQSVEVGERSLLSFACRRADRGASKLARLAMGSRLCVEHLRRGCDRRAHRIIETPLFARMTPVTWWDYPVWVASSVLIGLTAATYFRLGEHEPQVVRQTRRTIGASLLSVTAVGCPVCNKLVVAAIGVNGALNSLAPSQPLIGVLSVVLLGIGFVVRIRTQTACPIASRPDA